MLLDPHGNQSHRNDRLALDILDHAQTLVLSSAHGAIEFYFHTFDETFDVNHLFTASERCEGARERFCAYRTFFHPNKGQEVFNIMEDHQIDGEFTRGLEKRRRLNKTGENCYLDSDGFVTRDEDKIIACQRVWKERAYAPPGTPFAPRGYMYRKTKREFEVCGPE